MKKDLPRHITGAFKAIERFLPVVDVVVELVDARMPKGSRLKNFVKKLNKTSIIALSKADLANAVETKRWIERFSDEGLFALALNCRNSNSVKKLYEVIKNVPLKTAKTAQKKPLHRVRRVMIVGIPNVGKSTLINSLASRSAAKTANKPGVTRNIQWIKLNGGLELLDLPGVLDFDLLKRGDILELINTVPGKNNDAYTQAKNLTKILCATQNVGILPDAELAEKKFELFLERYAKKMNFCIKGGEADLNRAAADIIKRFQNGGFGRVTLEKPDNGFSDLFYLKMGLGAETANDSFD